MARWFLFACAWTCFTLSATPSRAAPPELASTVLAITLNGEPKGDFFIFVTAAGAYLVRPVDLEAMGIRGAQGETVRVEGEDYRSLTSVPGIDVTFDEKSLTLELRAAPALLGRRTVDLLPARHPNVLQSRDNSAFLNYRTGYVESDPGGASAFNLAAELGARLSDALFLSDFSHADSDGESRSLRLMSSLTVDRRADLQRLTLGDFFTDTGEPGSTLNLGGLSFSKQYSIDPYLIKQPMSGFVGALALPSEVEIYLDGVRVRTEPLPPGEFQVQNLNYYGGARNVEILIRDRFGREQRIDYQYYFTNTLLRKGFHEYSYDTGLQRKDFGLASNRYGELAASAFHRYGVSDSLTLGLQGQASGARLNFGPQGLMRLGAAGTASALLSASRDRDAGDGLAAQLGYGYQARSFSIRALARGFSADYARVGDAATSDRPKVEASAGIGYGTIGVGNFGADYALSTQYRGTARRAVTFSYSRSLPGDFNLFATLRRVQEETPDSELFVGLAYYPAHDITATYLRQDRRDSRSDILQVGKSAPIGEGWGFRVAAESAQSAAGHEDVLAPFLQFNGKRGIYTADCRSQSVQVGGRASSCQVAAAGAVGYVGGAFGFSRPIYDSFGLIQVGELEAVHVSHNNQVIGATDSSGRLFLPNLGSYVDNQISINDSDIPIEYAISERQRYVAPPRRGGALIEFGITRIRAIGGLLKIRVDGQTRPVEYHEIVLSLEEGGLQTFPTAKGGEFYLENVRPGIHPASFNYSGQTCMFDLTIPGGEEMFVDLGEVICEKLR